MKELTKGSPWKVILQFAIPLMIGYVCQNFYNLADSKIVSAYVSTKALGAVGATNDIFTSIIAFLIGMTQGFAIPIAASFGAQNYEKLKKNVAGTIVLTMGLGTILLILSELFIEKILHLLGTPQDLMVDAVSYIRIILAGILFSALYNMCANILRGLGDSKTPVICLLISVFVNIGLDYLFVAILPFGIQGAAYATIISQLLSGVLCLTIIWKKFSVVLLGRAEFSYDGKIYGELLSTGLAMAMMSCIVNLGSVFLQSAINTLGSTIVTAHTAARKIFGILNVILYCVALAMTTFSSQNMGAGEYGRIRKGLKQSLLMQTIMTTGLVIFSFLFARPILQWVVSSDNPEIINASLLYTKISVVFYYVLGPLLTLRCTLQGIGKKFMPVFTSFVEMALKILSAAFLVPALGYFGVALTEPISWVVMTIFLAAAYIKAAKNLKQMEKETPQGN